MSKADKIIAMIDSTGESLSLESWIDFLEEIIDDLQMKVDAAQQDLRKEKGNHNSLF